MPAITMFALNVYLYDLVIEPNRGSKRGNENSSIMFMIVYIEIDYRIIMMALQRRFVQCIINLTQHLQLNCKGLVRTRGSHSSPRQA